MKMFGKKIFLSLLFFILVGGGIVKAQSSCDSTCDSSDQGCLTKLQSLCQEKVSQLQSQANTLKNQIAQFDAQIRLTSLKIADTQNKISLLGGRIDQLGDSLTQLTIAFNSRAVETYKLSRFENNFLLILSASDINDAVNRFHYLQKIQEEDRNLLDRLTQAKTSYEDQKTEQETLETELKSQQASLNAQKTAKNNLLSATKSDEKKYQQLLSQAKAQLAAFQNFVQARGGAALLDNQTKCNEGWSGCYYNQRDSQWGNMYLGTSGYLMKYSGCFVTSVAMLASHSGKNIKPDNIASLPDAFTGGDVNWDFNVNGVHVHIDDAAPGSLDSKLASGPVMAKLFGGSNQHFIVILRKEGDTYYMNDPFLPDGYNKPLSAGGYTIGNIVSLRLVSFN